MSKISIDDALKSIEKRFGKEAICKKQEGIKFLPSGSIGLDLTLGGGWAKGRIAELYGWESSGKSTLALHAAANCQEEGKIVVYIDSEHAMDESYANALGVNTDVNSGLWYLSQPDSGEDAIEIGREFAKVPEVGLIVFDSNTAMIPKAVIEGEAGDSKMGLQARMFSQMIPVLKSSIKDTEAVILFIGQLREKIGQIFGSPETTTGGNALKFYASQRVKIWRSGQTKDGEEVVANGTKCKVEKNKVAPPFKTCQFDIEFGTGINKIKELLSYSIEYDIVKQAGSWFSYDTTKLGQGMNTVIKVLEDNPELLQEIQEKVFEKINS